VARAASRILLFALAALLASVALLLSLPPDALDFLPAGFTAEYISPEGDRPGTLSGAQDDLRRSPADPYRWCELAEALSGAGQEEQAAFCMRRAVELGSMTPPVRMRAANFHFSRGEPARVMEEGRDVLAMVSDFDGILFSSYRRLGIPAEEVLKAGLPDEARPLGAYLRYVLRHEEPATAALVWRELDERGVLDDTLARDYVQYLLKRKLNREASAAWIAYLGERRGDYGITNRVFNGAFEREFTGAPLDWRATQADGAAAAREAGSGRDGSGALRLEFDGTKNVVYRHLSQLSYLPHGSYRLRAMAKSELLTTDQGPYLQVTGSSPAGRLNAKTGQVRGSNGWLPLEVKFSVPQGGMLVTLAIRRDESWRIDNKIRGTLWVDEITVESN